MNVHYEKRSPIVRIDTVRDLGLYARDRRQHIAMTQAALAEAASVSRRWLLAFEAGKPTTEIGLVLRTLQALGLVVEVRPSDPQIDRPRIDLDAVLRDHRYDTDG